MARSEIIVETESWLSTMPFKSEAGEWLVIPSMYVGEFSEECLGDDQIKVIRWGNTDAPQPRYKR